MIEQCIDNIVVDAASIEVNRRARRAKTDRLDGDKLLAMPAPNPQALEDAQAFMRMVAALDIACCPHCKSGRLHLLQTIAADRRALAQIPPITACRDPP